MARGMVAATTADVVVIGAGVVGAAVAYFAARAGLRVAVLERDGVASGSTGAGEGNILVSDKGPGPELDLALRSLHLWGELAAVLDLEDIEWERKGGLVVATTAPDLAQLRRLAQRQHASGVEVVDVGADELAAAEPQLAAGFAGGVRYPQDAQVQPMLAAARLLAAAAREHGVAVHTHCACVGIDRAVDGRVVAVRTSTGRIATAAVVNAAGVWAGQVAALAGADLPVLPRRGFVLVTQPLPALVRHKVYTTGYAGDVASDAAQVQTSAVVEGTRAGTILIGASRERVGFDRSFALPVLGRLAAQAVALFPVLRGVHAIRAYAGLRPFSPDHLPIIGADPGIPGLWHACGHEGAGIGLAPATGELVAAALTGQRPPVDATPFDPSRFRDGPARGSFDAAAGCDA